ncbi:MAG: hypothetical protein J6Y04_07330, partial [Bacteroidaceae bacterium]|nr:hypothetical protein [Bacteroidaceae bacterium]
ASIALHPRLSQLTCGLLSSPLGIADASIALHSRLSQFIENQPYFGRCKRTPAELEQRGKAGIETDSSGDFFSHFIPQKYYNIFGYIRFFL